MTYRPFRKTAGVADAAFEAYWVASPGDAVMTREGFPGKVDSVLDGFAGGSETYMVTLDNEMGGGEYSGDEITKLDPSRTAAADISAEAVEAAMPATAVGIHMASDDYPELGDILTRRLPRENVVAGLGALAKAASVGSGTDQILIERWGDTVGLEHQDTYENGTEVWTSPLIDGVEYLQGPDGGQAIHLLPYRWIDSDFDSGSSIRPFGAWNIVDDSGQVLSPHPIENANEAKDSMSDLYGDADGNLHLDRAPDSSLPGAFNGWGSSEVKEPGDDYLDAKMSSFMHETPVDISKQAGPVDDFLDNHTENPTDRWSFDWCRFRAREHCYYPQSQNVEATREAGYAVWVPFDRGICLRGTWDAQRQCPVGQAGPHSGDTPSFTDATVPWEQGGQRGGHSSNMESEKIVNWVPNGYTIPPITSALAGLAKAAALDPEFRLHFTAAWSDIQAKAKRIREGGGVEILSSVDNVVAGTVHGDHGIYSTSLMFQPGAQAVAMWDCGCPWATYSWGRSGQWKKYEGRMCAHALALNYEVQSRGMFGREIHDDDLQAPWARGVKPIEPNRERPSAWRVASTDPSLSIAPSACAKTASARAMIRTAVPALPPGVPASIPDFLEAVARAHHEYESTLPGPDKDWARWYANFAVGAMGFETLFGDRPDDDEFAEALRDADEKYRASGSSEPWASFYARILVQKWDKSTGQAVESTGNPPAVSDLQRQFAITPVGSDFYANEADDISKAYRDLPVLDQSCVPLWERLGAVVDDQANALRKTYDIQVLDVDPYSTAEEMHADIDRGVYKVTSQHSFHPVWSTDTNVNFRIAHDILGHGGAKSDFSLKGEIMAYQAECQHTPVDLWPALFTEVVAQSAYANTHHLFGEQKVGLITLDQAEIDMHVGTIMDAPDAAYDALHFSASVIEHLKGLAAVDPFPNAGAYQISHPVVWDIFSDDDPADFADPLRDADDIPMYEPGSGTHILPVLDATLHDEPEPALPSTDGGFEDEDPLVAHAMGGGAPALSQGLEYLMSGPASAAQDTGDIAAAAEAFLQKTTHRAFNPMEQKAIIDEGEGDDEPARNFGKLEIKGTHYEALEAALAGQGDDDECWD